MIHDNNRDQHRFRVKLLFGLFEADATGTVAICAALVLFVLMGGRPLVGALVGSRA